MKHSKPVRLESRYIGTGPHLPFSRLVGAVSNCADAVRGEIAPIGGASVYLFLEFTITVGVTHFR